MCMSSHHTVSPHAWWVYVCLHITLQICMHDGYVYISTQTHGVNLDGSLRRKNRRNLWWKVRRAQLDNAYGREHTRLHCGQSMEMIYNQFQNPEHLVETSIKCTVTLLHGKMVSVAEISSQAGCTNLYTQILYRYVQILSKRACWTGHRIWRGGEREEGKCESRSKNVILLVCKIVLLIPYILPSCFAAFLYTMPFAVMYACLCVCVSVCLHAWVRERERSTERERQRERQREREW